MYVFKIISISYFKAVLNQRSSVSHKDQNTSMDHREQESHVRDAYPTQDTSRMRTARVKQEADTRIIV